MQCLFCQGTMQKSKAPFSLDRKGYHIFWDEIPAWVCTQCGEPYFESNEVELIQNAAAAVDKETEQFKKSGTDG